MPYEKLNIFLQLGILHSYFVHWANLHEEINHINVKAVGNLHRSVIIPLLAIFELKNPSFI